MFSNNLETAIARYIVGLSFASGTANHTPLTQAQARGARIIPILELLIMWLKPL